MTPEQPSAAVGAVANWYPDPTHRFEFRYHNGQSWTGDVSIHGQRFLDPLEAPGTGTPATRYVLPPNSSGSSTNRKAVAALVLGSAALVVGWVPFICVLAIAAAVLAFIFGVSGLRAGSSTPASGGRGLAIAGIVLAPFGLAVACFGIWFTAQVVREFDNFSNVGRYTAATTRCDVDASSVAHFDGTITNDSLNTQSYHLEVEFLRSGTTNTLYVANTDVADVPPGETARWSVQHSVNVATLDCRISAVTGPLPFANASR